MITFMVREKRTRHDNDDWNRETVGDLGKIGVLALAPVGAAAAPARGRGPPARAARGALHRLKLSTF